MSKPYVRVLLPVAAFLLTALSARAGMAPDETMKTLKLADGLEATLFASEPEIVNPVSIDVDSRGRVWLVEGANYRGARTIRPEGDRIVILEDVDGDGKAESVKVFAQDKSIFCPLGISVIGNKVYVAQSPKMLVYTIDASGDKPVGPPEVFLSGFSGVNHDHGLHAGMFGPDGRFYFNSGNSGLVGENYDKVGPEAEATGEIKNSKGEYVVDSTGSNPFPKGKTWRGKPKAGEGYKQGMAFRCNFDGTGFEVLGHNFRNNFEVTVDSFGTVWQSDNDDDGNQGVRINYVMEGGNFGYTGPSGWDPDIMRYPTQTRQEGHWHQRQPGIVPNLYNTGGGSPTGICVYEGELLPEKFRGALLHTNAGGQWYGYVGAFIPTAAAAGYKCELVELITSSDKFFKPDDVSVAPDGSVFVSDWYDGQSGGHGMTDKIPGKQQGRIYRLAPSGNKAQAKPKVDLETVPGQIAALCSPNNATRALGYMKLAGGGAPAEAALKELYKSNPNPRLRARALWILAQTADGKSVVTEALKDSNADIRVAALRAARLIKMDMISVGTQMLGDANYAVLREIALAMNYEPTEKAVPVLVALCDKIDPSAPESPVYDPKIRGKSREVLAEENKERLNRVVNRWFLEAVGIGAIGKEKEVLEAWQKDGKNKGDAKLAALIAWRMNKEIAPLPPKPAAEPKKEEPKK
jgi:putative membrane-bound dehydrogenase-like protein